MNGKRGQWRLAVFAGLALTLTAPLARALPPTPLTEYSTSPNVRLVTNVPTGVGVGGKFLGNYYFQTTARGTTRTPSDGGLWVFDVANPEAPKVVAHLPLPIWQNEDVEFSARRKLLLISADGSDLGTLFVYDIADPTRPSLKSSLSLPNGSGHTASCILDCQYVYVSGSFDSSVHVIDLRDPAAPKAIGSVKTPAGAATRIWYRGIVHDVHTDGYGNVWMAGSGGTALYAPIKDPLKPKLLAATSKDDNKRTNHLIHHNIMRLDKQHVLVGEEAFNGCGADEPASYEDRQGGRFQTWRIDLERKRLVPLALFQKKIPGVSSCSNHWFDINPATVAASAFYAGGVRFFDVRKPKAIRQVGWFRASDGSAGQTQFVPGRPDLVYVSDYLRGLDVIKIDAGGKDAKTQAEGDTTRFRNPVTIDFRPSAKWGYACPVPTQAG